MARNARSLAGKAGLPTRAMEHCSPAGGALSSSLASQNQALCSLIGTWIHRWKELEMIWISPLFQITADNNELLTARSQDLVFPIEIRPFSPGQFHNPHSTCR